VPRAWNVNLSFALVFCWFQAFYIGHFFIYTLPIRFFHFLSPLCWRYNCGIFIIWGYWSTGLGDIILHCCQGSWSFSLLNCSGGSPPKILADLCWHRTNICLSFLLVQIWPSASRPLLLKQVRDKISLKDDTLLFSGEVNHQCSIVVPCPIFPFATSEVCRYMSAPYDTHWSLAKLILCFVKLTISMVYVFGEPPIHYCLPSLMLIRLGVISIGPCVHLSRKWSYAMAICKSTRKVLEKLYCWVFYEPCGFRHRSSNLK
jgi:hypothetical protein